MKLERRRFVKLLTFGTATSMLAGKVWRREVMAFCENTATDRDAVFTIRVSDFPALQQDYGSVRLGINPVDEPYPAGPFFPFMINRDAFGQFHVLDCQCRHAGCVVPIYDNIQFIIRCPCHGSGYDIEGAVIDGPANQPLYRYESQFDGDDTLTIRAPCWGFEVKLAVLPGDPGSRVRLDFPTFPNVTYEVSFRERPENAWAIAAFASTPNGLADQTSLVATGLPTSVYLDRATATGMYAVGMKLSEV